MQQFSNVTRELEKWFQGFKWYAWLRSFELHLLFGGLGIMILREMSSSFLKYDTYTAIFYTFPLQSLAYHAFLVGAWLTLVSRNVKYLPYALWGYALYILYPFTYFSLSTLITAGVYAALGYGVFRYSVSSPAIKREQGIQS